MAKHAVMMLLDIDIELPETNSDLDVDTCTFVETITENTVKEVLEKRTKSIKLKIIRTKYLGRIK